MKEILLFGKPWAVLTLLMFAGSGLASSASDDTPPSAPPPPKRTFRMRNGIRLAGGSGGIGRLEVFSKDAWFTGWDYNKGERIAGWSPVCDSSLFDDGLAAKMCQMLGFTYGRKHYDPKLNFRTVTNESANNNGPLVGYVNCFQSSSYTRRSLRGLGSFVDAVKEARHILTSDSGAVDVAPRRSLYMPQRGTICTTRASPFTCEIFPGPCGPTGPIVALECSETPLPQAPPPPPRPPAPPPSPPPVSDSIRLIGGRFDEWGTKVELDLCPEGDTFCSFYGRVEVRVKDPSDENNMIWAPLCASTKDQQDWFMAGIVCGQAYNWPTALDGGLEITIPGLAYKPFDVPSDLSDSEGNFVPSQYEGWATITGSGASSYPRTVQDLGLEVSPEPCESLLAIQCTAYSSGLPEWPGLHGDKR